MQGLQDTTRPACTLDDAGVFVGLVAVPMGSLSSFPASELSPLFSAYKRRSAGYFPRDSKGPATEDYAKSLYVPVYYAVFGEYDIAVLSLVDDFDFAIRKFHPFAETNERGDSGNRTAFAHQVITGPTPRFSESILDAAKESFLAPVPPPLLAIMQVKVNVAGAIMGGTSFLRTAARAIRAEGKVRAPERMIILESHSWHELTLLVFGSSFAELCGFTLAIRSMSTGRLKEIAQAEFPDELMVVDEAVSPARLGSDATRIGHHGTWLALDDREVVFTHSLTTLGFSTDLLSTMPGDRGLRGGRDPWSMLKDDRISVTAQWSPRVGAVDDLARALKPTAANYTGSVGPADILEQYPNTTTRDFLLTFVEREHNASLRSFLPQKRTCIAAEQGIPVSEERQPVEGGGRRMGLPYSSMAYSPSQMAEIDKTLCAQLVPKITAMRVHNMFTYFNRGVADSLTLGGFLELRDLLDYVQDTALAGRAGVVSQDRLISRLSRCTDVFRAAWQNRFRSDLETSDITDYNLDYKGGIQQLITAFDGACKVIFERMGLAPLPVLRVSGDPGVTSSRVDVSVNYLYLFQPESFASVIAHEAASHIGSLIAQGKVPDVDPDICAPTANNPSAKDVIEGWLSRTKAPKHLWPYDGLLDVAMFDSLLADILACYLVFAADTRRFARWYWSTFAGMPSSYGPAGQYDKEMLGRILLRMIVVGHVIDPARMPGWLRGGVGECMESRLAAALSEYVESAIGRGGPIRDWCLRVRQYGEDLLLGPEKRRPKTEAAGRREDLGRLLGQIDVRTRLLASCLREGRVCPPEELDPEARNNAFFQVQAYLSAYLSLLEESWVAFPDAVRRENGEPKLAKVTAGLLPDPRGGTFVREPTVRRLYYKYRSAVTMALWDIAMRQKAKRLWPE